MTRAEAEQHARQYFSIVDQAKDAEKCREYDRALRFAKESFQHIDGMLSHAQREQRAATGQIESIELVCRYAPILFAFDILAELEELVIGKRRIAKFLGVEFDAHIEKARSVMARSHALWSNVERTGRYDAASLNRDFSDGNPDWRDIIRVWESLQLVRCCTTDGVAFVAPGSWSDEKAIGKCPECGATGRVTKGAILEAAKCSRCANRVTFVQIGDLEFVGGR